MPSMALNPLGWAKVASSSGPSWIDSAPVPAATPMRPVARSSVQSWWVPAMAIQSRLADQGQIPRRRERDLSSGSDRPCGRSRCFPVPATVVTCPLARSMARMAWFDSSATKSVSVAASSARPCGWLKRACAAGPSPKPGSPSPIVIVTCPSRSATTMRLWPDIGDEQADCSPRRPGPCRGSAARRRRAAAGRVSAGRRSRIPSASNPAMMSASATRIGSSANSPSCLAKTRPRGSTNISVGQARTAYCLPDLVRVVIDDRVMQLQPLHRGAQVLGDPFGGELGGVDADDDQFVGQTRARAPATAGGCGGS